MRLSSVKASQPARRNSVNMWEKCQQIPTESDCGAQVSATQRIIESFCWGQSFGKILGEVRIGRTTDVSALPKSTPCHWDSDAAERLFYVACWKSVQQGKSKRAEARSPGGPLKAEAPNPQTLLGTSYEGSIDVTPSLQDIEVYTPPVLCQAISSHVLTRPGIALVLMLQISTRNAVQLDDAD